MKRKTDHFLDIRDSIVPYALLKASQAFREMKRGETMEILVSDPDARKDLFRILPSACYEVIKIKDGRAFHRILLKKVLFA